jgi:hypothetical protein
MCGYAPPAKGADTTYARRIPVVRVDVVLDVFHASLEMFGSTGCLVATGARTPVMGDSAAVACREQESVVPGCTNPRWFGRVRHTEGP